MGERPSAIESGLWLLNDAVSAWSGSFKVEVPVLGVPSARIDEDEYDGVHDNSYRISWSAENGACAL